MAKRKGKKAPDNPGKNPDANPADVLAESWESALASISSLRGLRGRLTSRVQRFKRAGVITAGEVRKFVVDLESMCE